jgi:HAMP domain-containing protein
MKILNKIHKKFIAVSIFILLLSVGSSAVIARNYFSDTILKFAKDELKAKTEINADEISTYFDEKNKLASAIAKEPLLIDLLKQQATGLTGPHPIEPNGGPIIQNPVIYYDPVLHQRVMAYLKSLRQDWTNTFENIFIGDIWEQNMADAIDGKSMNLNLAVIDGEYGIEALNGKISMVPPIWCPNPGCETRMIQVTLNPVRSEDGVIGFVGFPLFIDSFVPEITKKTIGNGFNVLIGESGNLLIFPEKKYVSRRNNNYQDVTLDTYKLNEIEGEYGTGWADLSEKMLAGESGYTEVYDKNNEKFIVYYTSLKAVGDYQGNGWSIASAISENELLAQAKKMNEVILLVMLVSIIFGSLLIYILAKRVTKPIVKLTEVASQINQGNLDVEVGVRANDEVGELAASMEGLISGFKAMKGKK